MPWIHGRNYVKLQNLVKRRTWVTARWSRFTLWWLMIINRTLSQRDWLVMIFAHKSSHVVDCVMQRSEMANAWIPTVTYSTICSSKALVYYDQLSPVNDCRLSLLTIRRRAVSYKTSIINLLRCKCQQVTRALSCSAQCKHERFAKNVTLQEREITEDRMILVQSHWRVFSFQFYERKANFLYLWWNVQKFLATPRDHTR